MKEGFNPSSGEPPLRLTSRVEHKGDESKRGFCNYCAVLDPRLPHKARRSWNSDYFEDREFQFMAQQNVIKCNIIKF